MPKGPLDERICTLTEQYRWKAENIVRFFDHLEMTTKGKEDFLARELAFAYELGVLNTKRGLE